MRADGAEARLDLNCAWCWLVGRGDVDVQNTITYAHRGVCGGDVRGPRRAKRDPSTAIVGRFGNRVRVSYSLCI